MHILPDSRVARKGDRPNFPRAVKSATRATLVNVASVRMLPVVNVANSQLVIGRWNWILATLAIFSLLHRAEAEEAAGLAGFVDHRLAGGVEVVGGGIARAVDVVRNDHREGEAGGVHERRGEDDRLAVVVERDPEQREVARRNVEGVAEDVVDAARVGGVPRAGDDIGEKNSISR